MLLYGIISLQASCVLCMYEPVDDPLKFVSKFSVSSFLVSHKALLISTRSPLCSLSSSLSIYICLLQICISTAHSEISITSTENIYLCPCSRSSSSHHHSPSPPTGASLAPALCIHMIFTTEQLRCENVKG